jgi:linoleoyl-CoA desaturase
MLMERLKRPVFKKPEADDFFLKLHREVQESVLEDKSLQRLGIIKAVFLLVVYLLCYFSILAFGNQTPLLLVFYMLTGFSMIVLFINSFHDAVHGSLFEKPLHNKRFTVVLSIFGSNPWLWQKRHMTLHHAFPNIQHWDIDIKQSDIIRIFPESPLFPYHRYQHLYMWLIYPLYSLNWIYIRDFKDFFGTHNNYVKRLTDIPGTEIAKLFAAKIFNLIYLIAIPLYVLDQPWYIIMGGWLVMHVSGSMLGVIALISTHVDEDSHFPTAPEDGKIDMTWALHQMAVTKDFSADSKVANFLFGGFTHHVAHHLFPGVAHTYYPYITPIIRRYAKEYDLPYTCHPFYKAVRSHFRLLKNSGTVQNLFAVGEL